MQLEVGGLTESVTVRREAPLVDTTSKEIGGRISAQEFVDTPSFNRNFAGYLGMLPGVVATISATTFGADSISVAGTERPQRQLHDGRVEQQRHVQRRQRRRAGARAGRGGAGVPAAHQPVRRRVRPRLGRHRQLGVQAGHEPVPRQRLRVLSRTRSSPRTNTSPKHEGLEEADSEAAAVRRYVRRTDHPGQGALLRSASNGSCSTPASRPTSRRGPI